MHDLERRMVIELDALVRMSRYVSLRQKGMQADEATLLLKQFHAHYGDPDDSKFDTGDDRLLPYELRDRIKRSRLRLLSNARFRKTNQQN